MMSVVGILAAYLMGSVPFGMLAAGLKGVDLRSVGSGNIGATNVLRGAGKLAAIFTLLGDGLKGAAAVALGKLLGFSLLVQGLMGLSAVIGHNFSFLLKFKGGKGVATSMGMILVYMPVQGLLTVGLWVLVALVTRYSSLAAIASFVALPVFVLLAGLDIERLLVTLALVALIIQRHAGNIERLSKGSERKIGEKT